MTTLLEVNGLKTQFNTQHGPIYAVNGVSFTVNQGETLGIVGESGSGKSVTMLSVLDLIPSPPGQITAGTAMFNGEDVLRMSADDIRQIRGAQIGMVFQDPMASLNPVLTIGYQIAEPLRFHMKMGRVEARERAIELLDMVGISLPKSRVDQIPYQLSGGMRQRVMIAMALACKPQILIADEPTTALDVTTQAQIVDLVRTLRDRLGMGMIWITHDLGVVAQLADRVGVMYAGCIVEEAPVDELYANPQHPYTIALLQSLPRLDVQGQHQLSTIDGLPPVLKEAPRACPFAPRCVYAVDRCRESVPPLMDVGPEHRAACWINPETGEQRS